MFRMHDLQPLVSQNVIQIQCDEQIHCFGGSTLIRFMEKSCKNLADSK